MRSTVCRTAVLDLSRMPTNRKKTTSHFSTIGSTVRSPTGGWLGECRHKRQPLLVQMWWVKKNCFLPSQLHKGNHHHAWHQQSVELSEAGESHKRTTGWWAASSFILPTNSVPHSLKGCRALVRSFARVLIMCWAAAVPGNRNRASLGVRQESPSDYMSVCEEQHPSEQLAMVHGMLLVRRWELLLANGSASGMGWLSSLMYIVRAVSGSGSSNNNIGAHRLVIRTRSTPFTTYHGASRMEG